MFALQKQDAFSTFNQYSFRPFSTSKKGDESDEGAQVATEAKLDINSLDEKMKYMEREIEDSARANREFLNIDGVNLYDELKEDVRPD